MESTDIVSVVLGAVAIAAAVVAIVAERRSRTARRELAKTVDERGRLESELDTLAQLFTDQAELLAVAQSYSGALGPDLDGIGNAHGIDELGEDVFDPASGLLRERFVAVVLQQKVAAGRRKITPLSVLAIEIDRLRSASRAVIDDSMRMLGDVLRATLREADVACRLGDVLAIAVLEDTDQRGALLAAERARTALKALSSDALTVSVGISCYPAHALDAPELVTRAGEALGVAKAGGTTASQRPRLPRRQNPTRTDRRGTCRFAGRSPGVHRLDLVGVLRGAPPVASASSWA